MIQNLRFPPLKTPLAKIHFPKNQIQGTVHMYYLRMVSEVNWLQMYVQEHSCSTGNRVSQKDGVLCGGWWVEIDPRRQDLNNKNLVSVMLRYQG